MHELSTLSDDALLQDLRLIASSQHSVMADLVLHLAEVDARRIYANKGFPSLFSYCLEELRFSEDEACRRIEAARLGRRFPPIYGLLKTGTVTLSVLALLKQHLTEANHSALLAGVSGSSVRRAKEWLAARFPQPDVPWSIRKHPASRVVSDNAVASSDASRVVSDSAVSSPATSRVASDDGDASGILWDPSGSGPVVPCSCPSQLVPPAALWRGARSARVVPLSRDRFLVKVTVSGRVRDKLGFSRDLMSHANPSGDLAVVIERALDALLEKLEKSKLGQARRSEHKRRPAKGTHVARGTRREVVARDGLRCSFVAPDGRHCGARAFLEFDHEAPKGLGGSSEPHNVRLLCRAHNLLVAERIYGRAHMQRAIAASHGRRQAP